ncbi:uncharacterized protein LOC127951386 [Carassius gibelio]|uniref:uncharacterized protein LOC127951386 n=1 Tax=Carassius gibelio TaxID=101364 RepID=UPI002278F86F|nr:uncharacterized protein LOC127951386 [Carassius gibelio]
MMFLYIYIVILLEMPAVLGVSFGRGQKALLKAEGKTVYLPCNVTSRSYIHWYQMKDGVAPSRLLYINPRGGVTRNNNNPQANDFSVDKTKLYDLKLGDTQKIHTAVYFCTYWDSSSHSDWIKRFGSGTRLIVTERGNDQIKPPKLSGYLPSKKDNHGRQTMLCQARGMFPNLVKFEWKKKDGGQWNDPGGNTVEQNNEGSEVTVTSMLIMDKDKVKNDDYRCTVTHEGKSQNLDIKIENSKPAEESKPDKADVRTSYIGCPTSSTKEPNIMQISGDSEQIPSMSLFVYAYGVMLVKNGLFFCIVSIFLLQRNAGKKDKKSSET